MGNSISRREKTLDAEREVRTMEEEARMVKAVGMKKQGSWLNWEGVRKVKLGWNHLECSLS